MLILLFWSNILAPCRSEGREAGKEPSPSVWSTGQLSCRRWELFGFWLQCLLGVQSEEKAPGHLTRADQGKIRPVDLLDPFSSEKRVTIYIVYEGFTFHVITGDRTSTGVKVTPASKLLTQRGAVMLSPWDLVSILGKVKCEIGKNSSCTLMTLSKVLFWEGLNVIPEMAVLVKVSSFSV